MLTFFFFFFYHWHIEVFSTWVWSSFSEDLSHIPSLFLYGLEFPVVSIGFPSWNIQYIQSALTENSLIESPGLREPARDVSGTVKHLNNGKELLFLGLRNKKRGQCYWSPKRDGTMEKDLPQTSSGKIDHQHFSSSLSYPAYTSAIHPLLAEHNWKPRTTITTNLAMQPIEASFPGHRAGQRKAERNLGEQWRVTSSSALSFLLNQISLVNSLHLALSSSYWLFISKQGVLVCLGCYKNIPLTR